MVVLARPTRLARAALAAHRAGRKLHRVLEVVLDTTTLALFPDDWADLVTSSSYSLPSQYEVATYNAQGLFEWESKAVREYFPRTGTVLVTSAGGGREALVLSAMGYRVVATECVGTLAQVLSSSLAGDPRAIALHAPPDAVPREHGPFDAVVVGWGAYTHLVGRERRVAFLRRLAEACVPGAPILLSYWQVGEETRSTRLVAAAANAVRRPLGRRLIEPGESTSIRGWSRTFRPDEVRDEATTAGLGTAVERTTDFPHIVLRASG